MTSEAWEALCPELPPGWSVYDAGDYGWAVFPAGSARVEGVTEWAKRSVAVKYAWEHFGITRRAYAESIAIAKVREAADRWACCVGINHGVEICAVGVEFGIGEVIIRIADGNDGEILEEHVDIDICTAALRAIEALGGDA